jgi:hypothetical protein
MPTAPALAACFVTVLSQLVRELEANYTRSFAGNNGRLKMTEPPERGGPLPPPPRRPIAAASERVKRLRRFGLVGILVGFVLVMGRYLTDGPEWLADAGGIVFLGGMAVYFAATFVRLWEWHRE